MRPSENIENVVKKMNFTAGAELREQILADALKAHEQAGTQPAFEKPNIWRIIMKSKITKLSAAAAVIIIASVIGVQFLTGTNAYAQVAEQLRKAQSVVFTIITQDNQGNGETIKTDIAYKEPGHLRTTTVDGYIVVFDGTTGKGISIVPGGGYTLAEINSIKQTGTGGYLASIEAMKNLPANADERLDPKEIDGIVCSGYRVKQGDLTTTVWVGAKSGDLVQVEQKYASAPGMNKIIKNIKFDEVLDDSLFSLTPPAGYKTGGFELKGDTSAETEETFIAWLRWWSSVTVDETFPPIVAGPQIAKIVMDMHREGKFKGPEWSNADAQKMFQAMLFVSKLPNESNWRYMGENVKFGTPDKPIFWYRPAGGENYRVIYANLTVREMAEDQLPK